MVFASFGMSLSKMAMVSACFPSADVIPAPVHDHSLIVFEIDPHLFPVLLVLDVRRFRFLLGTTEDSTTRSNVLEVDDVNDKESVSLD